LLQLIDKFISVQTEGSKVGTPQGGNLSSILVNVVLHQFDKYMENVAMKFNRGMTIRANPQYNKIKDLRIKAIKTAEIKRQELFKVPMVDYKDPTFRRIMYVRYADDFVILVEGTKHESIHIKNNLKEFLITHCGVKEDKTTITNLNDNKFNFLGATIVKPRRNSYLDKIRRRPHLRILINTDKLVSDLVQYGFVRRSRNGSHVPKAYTSITNLTHHEIINFFNARLFYASLLISRPDKYLWRYVIYLLQFSCAYTLARKLKIRPFTKVFKLFGKRLTCPNTKKGLNLPDIMKHNYKNTEILSSIRSSEKKKNA
jgi:hypothetical protein